MGNSEDTTHCGARRCKAKSKRTGERCKANAMVGKSVCAQHGGKSPGAPIKHGRRSKFIQYVKGKTLEGILSEMERAEDAVDQTDTLHLLDAMLAKRLSQLSEVGSAEQWREAKELLEKAIEALANQEYSAARRGLEDLRALLREGAREQEREDAVLEVIEKKQKVAKTQISLVYNRTSVVTANEVRALLGVIEHGILTILSNPSEKNQLLQYLAQHFSAGHGHAGDGADR